MVVLIDSIDKRMTIKIIENLKKNKILVHGIGFYGEESLSKLEKIHYVKRETIKNDLKKVFSEYSKEDVLIFGNPIIIYNTNIINPEIKKIFPSNKSVELANNKDILMKLADSIGIKVPIESDGKIFPYISKLKISENTKLKPSERYKIIKNLDDYKKSEKFLKDNKDNLIFQEYVEGSSFGVSMLLDNSSELVDFIMHERILEYPISGGPSSLCRSVYNEDLVKDAYKLLKSLNWKGFAMVEFKGDYLIEINPRFWGSMPLISIAKSNFFLNYININLNDYKNIDCTKIQFNLNKYMNYFPQVLLSIIGLLKLKEYKKSFVGLITAFCGIDGTFMFKNPIPFFRYMKSLVLRAKNK